MNGPQHYAAAERLIHRSEEIDPQDAALFLQQAQVHATLAHAAATIDAGNVAVWTSNIDGQSHEVANSGDWQEAMR